MHTIFPLAPWEKSTLTFFPRAEMVFFYFIVMYNTNFYVWIKAVSFVNLYVRESWLCYLLHESMLFLLACIRLEEKPSQHV